MKKLKVGDYVIDGEYNIGQVTRINNELNEPGIYILWEDGSSGFYEGNIFEAFCKLTKKRAASAIETLARFCKADSESLKDVRDQIQIYRRALCRIDDISKDRLTEEGLKVKAIQDVLAGIRSLL